jgi:hypothetical protein
VIEINLLPEPVGPDPEMRKVLAPSIAYFLDLSFKRAQQSQNEEEIILWGRIWASLLHLRREYIQPGFSQADNFAEKLIKEEEDVELFIQALFTDNV